MELLQNYIDKWANIDRDKGRLVTKPENKEQAEALAGFLKQEIFRHIDDIANALEDLCVLKSNWNINLEPPDNVIFMKTE